MEKDLKQEMDGAFDALDEAQQQAIIGAVAYFHFRNTKKYDDGSLGEIYISGKQLRDLLAYWQKRHC